MIDCPRGAPASICFSGRGSHCLAGNFARGGGQPAVVAQPLLYGPFPRASDGLWLVESSNGKKSVVIAELAALQTNRGCATGAG